MATKTKHLHKRVLNLEIGDDEDPILSAPRTPELEELHQQFMDSIKAEGGLMQLRGECIREWAGLHESGDDATEAALRWKAVEREIAENTAKREAIAHKSQQITADLMKVERKNHLDLKAARLSGSV